MAAGQALQERSADAFRFHFVRVEDGVLDPFLGDAATGDLKFRVVVVSNHWQPLTRRTFGAAPSPARGERDHSALLLSFTLSASTYTCAPMSINFLDMSAIPCFAASG